MHYSAFDFIVLAIFLISFSVFIQKPTPIYLKLFPVYFFGALVSGLRQEWLYQHGKYNTGVANVWGIIEFCFYFFVLHEIIVNIKVKRGILYVSVFFALFAFFNIIIIQHKVGFNPVNFTIGCLITVLACIYYFVELFQKTETPSLSRLPEFWISSAILFNTVLSFPTFALEKFLEESTKVSKATQLLYRNLDSIVLITVVFTIILYTIGFLCRIRFRKSTL
jgi:hypothetical protein